MGQTEWQTQKEASMQAAEVELTRVFIEAEKQSRVAVLLERLHAKHSASRPWQETSKVVRQAMVRPPVTFLCYTLYAMPSDAYSGHERPLVYYIVSLWILFYVFNMLLCLIKEILYTVKYICYIWAFNINKLTPIASRVLTR